MIRFYSDYSLKAYNTFGIDSKASYFFEFTEITDLHTFLNSNKIWNEGKYFILGGGSNVLFVNDFDGLVIHPNIPGIKVIKEDKSYVWVEAGAGEKWDDFVEYCVRSGYGGLENLSFIPGTVGAAPVQNIGAYGKEVSEFIESVNGYGLLNKSNLQIRSNECNFGYRDSIFKNELKGSFIVNSVVFKLDKFPEFELSYGDIVNQVDQIGEASLLNIRKAIIQIRSSKLPDPEKIGNAGSFFKNPAVKNEIVYALKEKYSEMPVYSFKEGLSKIPAGWLIEQAGWKGYKAGNVGVYKKQALVLVNYGNATGLQIFELSEKIRESVYNKFGIQLEHEVNILK